MRISIFAASCASLFFASAACAGDAPSMENAVKGFYAAYSTFHPSDGIPDAAGRARYMPYISDRLERLLAEGAAAEDNFNKANKDSPPLLEGDIFTSNFEGATSFAPGMCKASGRTGRCTVNLVYDDVRDNPKDKPVHWSDTVDLVETANGWRVDDIEYGASWAFANKGTLSATLTHAIADSSE